MPIARMMNLKPIFITILSACLYFTAGLLAAETIMVSVGDPGGKGGDEKITGYLLSALEDGIMEEFFLAGHIVFNGGTSFSAGTPRKIRDIRDAKQGGASRLFLVDVYFRRSDKSGPVPERVIYSLLSVSDQKSLAEGSLTAAELERPSSLAIEEFCARLGKETARRVLGSR
jgi:hypothetical protein